MIHIICADLSRADADIYRKLYEQASPERQHRADRYRRQEDRLRCTASAALLKAVLGTGHYQTEESKFGKPYIKDRPGFYFNLSHSGRYAVIAYGDTEVGVDVQQHTVTNMEAIAKRWFAPDEQAYIRNSTGRFYEIWTGKESYVKYLGKGLHQDLQSFSVLAPEPGIRYHYRRLGDDYSLSLCSTDPEYTFELLDVQQLLSGNRL